MGPPLHREELAGFAQELLPLRSRLTSHGDQTDYPPGWTDTYSVSSDPRLPHSRGSLLRPNSPSAPRGLPPGSNSSLPHQDDHGPLEAERPHPCGGEGHMTVPVHMAALAGSSGSATPRRSPVVTTLAIPVPVRGGLPPISGPSSRGHTESATDPC